MAKRINLTAIRLFLIGIVALVVLLIAIIPLLFPEGETSSARTLTPAFAPAEYAYPEFFTEQELSGGFTWRINDSGNIVISDGVSRYHILDDGTVYKEEEDGTLSVLEDEAEIKAIYSVAEEAVETSDAAADYFIPGALNYPYSDAEVWRLVGDAITPEEFRELQALGLYPDDIAALLEEGLTPNDIYRLVTRDISPEDLRDLFDLGLTAEDVARMKDEGYSISDIADLVGDVFSEEDFASLLEAGVEPEAILDLINDGYTPEEIILIASRNPDAAAAEAAINDRLEETIVGTGITLDDLKEAIEDAGLTPEEYIRGIDRMREEESTASTIDSSISSPPIAVSSSDLPPIAVSLGGSSSSRPASTETNTGTGGYQSSSVSANDIASALSAVSTVRSDYDSQNNQAGKSEFMSSFGSNTGYEQLTKNDVAAGTIVTMILKTGLNSDLPGMIVAEVTHNVFDSLTGTVLLIPKGTRLLASYDSSVSWGQKRALIAWTQMIRPDGLVLRLPGLPGIDAQGYTGVMDKVDNHTWDLIWSAFLASVIDLGISDLQTVTEDYGIYGDAALSFVNTLDTAGQEYLKKQMNKQPTLTIRPGRTIKLLVTQTLNLKPYKL